MSRLFPRLCLRLAPALSLLLAAATVQAAPIRAVPGNADQQLGQIQILDAGGAPLAGATLAVQAIPIGEAHAWGPHPWPSAGQGSTDATGHPVVTLQPPTSSSLRSADGVVNYELYLQGPRLQVPVLAFSRYYGTDAGRAQGFAQQSESANITLDSTQSTEFHTPAVSSSGSVTPNTCSFVWVEQSTRSGNTVVGDLHSAGWTTTAQFLYGGSADSSISVGFSSNGGSTWSISGTTYVSQSKSSQTWINVAGQDYGHQLFLPFMYEEDRGYDCGWTSDYQVLSDYWEGGTPGTGADTSSNDFLYYPKYALRFYANTGWTTTTETAYTYSAGVAVYGATLHAESGYSTYTELKYTAGSIAGCYYGLSAYPNQAQIVNVGDVGFSC